MTSEFFGQRLECFEFRVQALHNFGRTPEDFRHRPPHRLLRSVPPELYPVPSRPVRGWHLYGGEAKSPLYSSPYSGLNKIGAHDS